MLVDGKPLSPGFQKGTGFVQHQDNHLPTQTVSEAIEFSPLRRQPREFSKAQKLPDVDYIIKLLELDDLQDAIIGFPSAGLGVERRKRVTIAVELAAKPDLLLFLDEPTSGLDSAGAASIVRLLRKLADDGQAILCTIHRFSFKVLITYYSSLWAGVRHTSAKSERSRVETATTSARISSKTVPRLVRLLPTSQSIFSNLLQEIDQTR
jgi:ATP-binding cassette, subfamily G (WHITE), member 2, SNQ2